MLNCSTVSAVAGVLCCLFHMHILMINIDSYDAAIEEEDLPRLEGTVWQNKRRQGLEGLEVHEELREGKEVL